SAYAALAKMSRESGWTGILQTARMGPYGEQEAADHTAEIRAGAGSLGLGCVPGAGRAGGGADEPGPCRALPSGGLDSGVLRALDVRSLVRPGAGARTSFHRP